MLYNNPLFTAQENLEVAIGAIDFQNQTIKNLRAQIKALRYIALAHESTDIVEKAQFAHLENTDASVCSN